MKWQTVLWEVTSNYSCPDRPWSIEWVLFKQFPSEASHFLNENWHFRGRKEERRYSSFEAVHLKGEKAGQTGKHLIWIFAGNMVFRLLLPNETAFLLAYKIYCTANADISSVCSSVCDNLFNSREFFPQIAGRCLKRDSEIWHFWAIRVRFI